MYINDDKVTYFDGFEVEYIPKEIWKFIEYKNVTANIYGIHAYNSVMWGYLFTRFIDFMLNNKWLTGFTNLISPNSYKSNDRILLKHFH